MSKSTYTVRAVCNNCGKTVKFNIPKGTSRAEWKGVCPNCGVSGQIEKIGK